MICIDHGPFLLSEHTLSAALFCKNFVLMTNPLVLLQNNPLIFLSMYGSMLKHELTLFFLSKFAQSIMLVSISISKEARHAIQP